MKLARRIVVALTVLGAAGVYTALGYYRVSPDEQAVVLRLGRYARTVSEGIHWHAPGLERVEKRVVTITQRTEFGYRTLDAGPPPRYEEIPDEQQALTGDENLVSIQFVVQYRIRDLADYLFGTREPEVAVRDAAASVLREVVARHSIDDILTEGKGAVAHDVKTRLQGLLDEYGTGVEIQSLQLQDVVPPAPVKDAFAAVNSAEQDRERLILEARGYAAEVVPKARGEAAEILNQARAYGESRVLRASGEAARFRALLAEYQRAPNVTRERLYLETIEKVLPKVDLVILDERSSGEGVLPYLPLGRGREGRGLDPRRREAGRGESR
ncbi:MAG: FtsH protease activity modulator HflK [Myxococcota bacterium]